MPRTRVAETEQKANSCQSLGTRIIDLQIAPGQTHSFFNNGPWQTVTLIAADRFLIKQGFLTGESTKTMPETGEKLVTAQP
jgi:hypothetical protein